MAEILIVKLGALGDVVRTTPLLRRLSGRVTWVASRAALPLIEGHPRVARAVPIEEAGFLASRSFDLVVNFDEDKRACRLAGRARARRTVGAVLKAGRLDYCRASAPWFDMGLISKLGKKSADLLKARARRSYQDYLFSACGLSFRGEEYWLPLRPRVGALSRVALEDRVGERWPAKAWPGFDALEERLRSLGFETTRLRQRRRVADYLEDINGCGLVVAGDTLAMHAGLALRKRVVAIFNCTSPHEIHDYGRLHKIVNARLSDYFFTRRALPRSAAVPLVPVERAISVAARELIVPL